MSKASFVFISIVFLALAASSEAYRVLMSLSEQAFFDLYENGQAIAKNVNYKLARYGQSEKFVLQTVEQKVLGATVESKTHYQILNFNQDMSLVWEKTVFNTEVKLLPEYDALIEVSPTPEWLIPDKVKMYDLKTGTYILAYQTDLNPYSKERPLAVQVSWFTEDFKPRLYFIYFGAQEVVVNYGSDIERMHFTIFSRGKRTQYALRHHKKMTPISFEGFTCENIHLAVTEQDTRGARTVVQRSPDYIAITSASPQEESPEISGFELRMSCLGMDLSVPIVEGQLDLTKTRGLNSGYELVLF